MSFVAVAIGGSAVAGYFGASAAADAQAEGTEQAARMAKESTIRSTESQERMLERQIELNEPFRQLGITAMPGLLQELGFEPVFIEDNQADAKVGGGGDEGLGVGPNGRPLRRILDDSGNMHIVEELPSDRPGVGGKFLNIMNAEYQSRDLGAPPQQFDTSQNMIQAGSGRPVSGWAYKGAPTFDQFITSPEANALREMELSDIARATDASASASGKMFAPATRLALQDEAMKKTRFSKAGQYDEFMNRRQNNINNLLNLVNVGRGASTQMSGDVGSAGANISNNIMQGGITQANLAQTAGTNRASGYINATNVFTGAARDYAAYNILKP